MTRGFTLIEVAVALVVGGMALTAAAALYQGLGSQAEAIQASALRVDRDGNAERLLRGLWTNLRVGEREDSGASVRGDSATVAFKAWCPTPEGWLRACAGRLAIERDEPGVAVRLHVDTPPSRRPVTLWSALPAATFRYLRNAGHGGTWQSRWSDLVIPPAIAVVMGNDTLIVAAWQ
jgi:prepilin-type N-terminal cleavage/methylation domain-containing protein